MPDPNQPTVPAGWYPDGQGGQRWWDGTQWTEHTQPPAGPAADATVLAPQPQQPPHQQPPAQPQGQQPPQQPPYGQPQQYGQQYGQPAWTPPPTGGSGRSGGGRKLALILGGGAAALLVLLLLVVVLVKVVGGGSPGDVAKEYLEASFESDYAKVCELTAEDQRESLISNADADDCGGYAEDQEKSEDEQFEDFEDEYDLSLDDVRGNFDFEVEVQDVDEDGDEASVEVRQTTEYTEDDAFLDEELDGDRSNSQTFTMKLVEEDGEWKVEEPYSVD